MDRNIVLMTANTGGGIIQFTVQLYHSLVELGCKVTVCVPSAAKDSNVSEVNEADLLTYKKEKKVFDNAPYRALAKRIAEKKPDCIWYCDDSAVCAKTGIALSRYRIVQMLTVHDAGGYHPTNRVTLKTALMRAYLKALCRRWYRSVSRFVLLSPESENSFKRRFVKSSSKAVCMNLGAHIPHNAEIMPPEMGTLKRERYLLFFGRIDKYKGIENLLNAYSRAPLPHLPLVIAGSGSLTENEKQLAFSNERITVINRFIADGEMKWLFANCAAVMLPYIEATQSGVIPIAYAYGKPVAVSDVPGLTQFVDDGKTGTICKNENDWINAITLYSGETDDNTAAAVRSYYDEHMDWEKNLKRLFENL